MYIRHHVSFPAYTLQYKPRDRRQLQKTASNCSPQLEWLVYGSSREVAQDVTKIMQMLIHQYVGTGLGS